MKVMRYITRSALQAGNTFHCGQPPTDGSDHRPFVGEHVATVQPETDEDRIRVRCACGHTWGFPRATETVHHMQFRDIP